MDIYLPTCSPNTFHAFRHLRSRYLLLLFSESVVLISRISMPLESSPIQSGQNKRIVQYQQLGCLKLGLTTSPIQSSFRLFVPLSSLVLVSVTSWNRNLMEPFLCDVQGRVDSIAICHQVSNVKAFQHVPPFPRKS